ncbi:MAG: glycerophosphodiester phosphodiesterase family protein [Chloroflexota bacterium]
MLVIGHRGAMGHAPENTLESIQAALDLGVDWIEIDVYAVDSEIVVIHDNVLMRTTNGFGRVMKQKLDYLRSLDAGNGQKIPLLSEVIGLIDGKVGLNVELKGPNTAEPIINFLDNQLPDHWDKDKILLSSFEHVQLEEAKRLNPTYKRAPLFWKNKIDHDYVVNELEAIAVNPWLPTVTQKMVDDAHAHNLQVLVYTVNKPEDIEKMRSFGVDGIFTNYPDRV